MQNPGDGRFPFATLWTIVQWVVLAGLSAFLVMNMNCQEAVAARPLSLNEAIRMALSPDGNARVEIAGAMVEEAKARSGQARSALLPNVDGAISQSSQTRNLQALGIQFNLPVPGFEAPRFVGPFDVFDARLSATQTIFSLSSIRRYQASREGISVAQAEEANAREQVAAQVARTYYAALRAQAQRDAAAANQKLAQELEELSRNQKTAGTGLAVEVTRSMVQRSQADQALLIRENELRATLLQLRKAIGLPLGGAVALQDAMLPPTETAPVLESAMETAMRERPDFRSQQARTANAQLLHSASKWERLPSVTAFGDYGASGNTPGQSLPTRAVGVAVRLPVFDGGRRDAQRAESQARLRQEELRVQDLREQIELELRLALDALESTANQTRIAAAALEQAELELTQARRRYEAGVASSLEVTRAQSSVEQARANNIDSLFRYNLARVDYALATGQAESLAP